MATNESFASVGETTVSMAFKDMSEPSMIAGEALEETSSRPFQRFNSTVRSTTASSPSAGTSAVTSPLRGSDATPAHRAPERRMSVVTAFLSKADESSSSGGTSQSHGAALGPNTRVASFGGSTLGHRPSLIAGDTWDPMGVTQREATRMPFEEVYAMYFKADDNDTHDESSVQTQGNAGDQTPAEAAAVRRRSTIMGLANTLRSMPYYQQYVESLYGPYLEKMPKVGGTVHRSLHELAASTISSTSNDWGTKWRQLLAFEPASLKQLGTKYQLLNKLAADFAESVTPTAVRIVDERQLAMREKTLKPIPSFENVYLHRGVVYTFAYTPARIALYGNKESTKRMVANELKAVRAVLGLPFSGTVTPLCATVQQSGCIVFAAVPLPIKNTAVSLIQGTFGARGQPLKATTNGKYNGYRIAEALALEKHFARAEETHLSQDIRQFECKEDNLVYITEIARLLPPTWCSQEFSKFKATGSVEEPGKSRHPLEDHTAMSHLSLRFRPEFMRMVTTNLLNPDSGMPNQSGKDQEAVGHAIHVLYTQQLPLAITELLQRQAAGTLARTGISNVLHQLGINVRYLGRIAVVLTPHGDKRVTEAKAQLLKVIQLEIVARAWKSLVNDALAADYVRTRQHETETVVKYLQLLLMCAPESEQFWHGALTDRMKLKFDYSCYIPVTPTEDDSVDTKTNNDPNSLQFYRAIKNTKCRVEKLDSGLRWHKDDVPGKVMLDSSCVNEQEAQNAVLVSLLGAGAKVNMAIYRRAVAAANLEVVPDLRGKKLVVSGKPKVRSCRALIMSPALQVVVDRSEGCTLEEVLTKPWDVEETCDAVEAAARPEIQKFMSFSESDPRASLPVQLLIQALVGKHEFVPAYQLCTQWSEYRKNIQNPALSSQARLDASRLYALTGRMDRAESEMVEGLKTLVSTLGDYDHPLFGQWLYRCGCSVAQQLLSEGRAPAADRFCIALEYMYAALGILEDRRHPLVSVILNHIAQLVRRFEEMVSCKICRAPATAICPGCCDHNEKTTASERDSHSIAGSRTTALTQQQRAATMRRGRRTRAEEARAAKEEEEQASDAFVKAFLPSLDVYAGIVHNQMGGVTLPNDSMESSVLAGATDGKNEARSEGPLSPSSGKSRKPVGQQHKFNAPRSQLLSEVPQPSLIVKQSRYLCTNCAQSQQHRENHPDVYPILREAASIFTRVVKLVQRAPILRPVGDPTLANALLSLGVLESDPNVVTVGLEELTSVFGASSRPVIQAELQLTEVMLSTSVLNDPFSPSTKRNVDRVMQAEGVLRQSLGKLLKKPNASTAYTTELSTMLQVFFTIVRYYSELPAAKQEHNTLHYLVQTLPGPLGTTSEFYGSALGQITSYYLRLSKLAREEDTAVATATALGSAGTYACQWLEVHCGRASGGLEDVESIITLLREKVIRVLRSAGPAGREKAQSLAQRCHSIVDSSPYAHKPEVVKAMGALDEVFRIHAKVVDRSAKTTKIKKELDAMLVELPTAVRRLQVHQHDNGVYMTALRQRLRVIREFGTNVPLETRDSSLIELSRRLVSLHDELLEIKDPSAIHQRYAKQPGLGSPSGHGDKGTSEDTAGGGKSGGGGGEGHESRAVRMDLDSTAASKGHWVSPYAQLATPVNNNQNTNENFAGGQQKGRQMNAGLMSSKNEQDSFGQTSQGSRGTRSSAGRARTSHRGSSFKANNRSLPILASEDPFIKKSYAKLSKTVCKRRIM